MDVTWPDGHGPDGELTLSTGDVMLRWHPGNQWSVPAADVPDAVWPQLPAVGGLTLDGGPLPATKPA